MPATRAKVKTMTDKATGREVPVQCCRKYMDLPSDRRGKWLWQVLHRWSHSRIPFTLARLADDGRATPAEAADAIKAAIDRKWIFWSGTTGPGKAGDPLYTGLLPKG
jgi:hypothetical protein